MSKRRAVLQATTALVMATTLMPMHGAAHVQDATWLKVPGSFDFNAGTNWSTGTVPTDTAFFDTTHVSSVSISSGTYVSGWTFNAGATN